MREPLNQFADRIMRNGEVREFIFGLVEKGFSIQTLDSIVTQAQSHKMTGNSQTNEMN